MGIIGEPKFKALRNTSTHSTICGVGLSYDRIVRDGRGRELIRETSAKGQQRGERARQVTYSGPSGIGSAGTAGGFGFQHLLASAATHRQRGSGGSWALGASLSAGSE